MMIRFGWFNLYFAAAVALAAGFGCQSPGQQKEMGLLRVHLEVGREVDTNRCTVVQIPRTAPVELQIDRTAFLTEVDLKDVKVTEDPGGFSIWVQFNRKGSWLLEQYTSGNRGKHLAIYAQFIKPGEQKHTAGRWLAAPRINQRLADGILVFAPDATRDEADELVLGLHNVIESVQKKSMLPDS